MGLIISGRRATPSPRISSTRRMWPCGPVLFTMVKG